VLPETEVCLHGSGSIHRTHAHTICLSVRPSVRLSLCRCLSSDLSEAGVVLTRFVVLCIRAD